MADHQRRAADRQERRDPMSDESAEAALLFLANSAERAGVAKAHMIYLEHFRKVTLARLRREAPEKTVDGRDNWARSHPEYAEVLQAQVEAVTVYETLHWKRAQAEATISAWQTRNANQRGAHKMQ